MDIDLLGKIDNIEKAIQVTIRDILAVPSLEYGIVFFPDAIPTSRINEEADYHGIQVAFHAELDSARINMKVDIGFGDIVYAQPKRMLFRLFFLSQPLNYFATVKKALLRRNSKRW